MQNLSERLTALDEIMETAMNIADLGAACRSEDPKWRRIKTP
jgi:hypothetical protein